MPAWADDACRPALAGSGPPSPALARCRRLLPLPPPLWAFAWCGTLRCAAQVPDTVHNVTSSDELLSALLENEQHHVPACQKQRTVLRLANSFALNLTHWPAGGVYLTSNVSIVGASPNRTATYLDFSAGISLFFLRGRAHVRLEQLVLANLAPHPAVPLTVPMFAFSYSRCARRAARAMGVQPQPARAEPSVCVCVWVGGRGLRQGGVPPSGSILLPPPRRHLDLHRIPSHPAALPLPPNLPPLPSFRPLPRLCPRALPPSPCPCSLQEPHPHG